MCMKNRGMLFMFSELMVGGAILLLAGMGGTAWAVPVNASHHATSVQTTSPETLGMTDLFGPGVSQATQPTGREWRILAPTICRKFIISKSHQKVRPAEARVLRRWSSVFRMVA